MKTGWNRSPCFRQRDHRASIQDAETEEVIELQAHAVHGPFESTLGIEEGIAFRCQYSQVLDVPPRQRRTGKKKKRHECTITTLVKGKFLISFTWLPKRERIRQQLPVRLPKFPNAFSCIYRTSRWWPVLSSRNRTYFFFIEYIFFFYYVHARHKFHWNLFRRPRKFLGKMTPTIYFLGHSNQARLRDNLACQLMRKESAGFRVWLIGRLG